MPSPYPIALARRWVLHRIGWWDAGRGLTLAIARAEVPDALIGTVSLRRYPRDRRAELGYWLSASAWGQGLATEAARAIVALGFDGLGLARVYAKVFTGNLGSIAVLTKLGLEREGVLRRHIRQGGRLLDVAIYGVLRDDWRAR